MKLLKGFIQWLADSHIIISAAAAAFSWSAFEQLGLQPHPYLLALIGFATLATYNLQNLLRRLAPHRPEDLPSAWTHLIPAVIGLTGTIASLLQLDSGIIPWLTPPAILSVLYAAPVFPYRGLKIALRGVPWIKIYLILFVWLWVTGLLPVVNSGSGMDSDTVLFLLQRGFLVLSLLIPFDIRDLKTDYRFQRTLPQILGIRLSLRVSRVSVVLYMTTVLIRLLNGAIAPAIAVALLVTGILTYTIVSATSEQRSDYFFTIGIDSLLWIQAALIWIIVH